MPVVSNTSPLSALSIIGRLDLLQKSFGVVRIPSAVWTELSRLDHQLGRTALEKAHADGWLQVAEVGNRSLVEVLEVTLDAGESEAIALAAESSAELLIMDESQGRSMARNLQLRITGTLGILLKAKHEGTISSLGLEMDRLKEEAGFFVSPKILQFFLMEAGEI